MSTDWINDAMQSDTAGPSNPGDMNRLRDLLEQITPGKWDNNLKTAAGQVWVDSSMSGFVCQPEEQPSTLKRLVRKAHGILRIRRDSIRPLTDEEYWAQMEANAEFIALARNLMPDLLAAAEERDRLREEHDHVCLRSGCMVTSPVRMEGGQHDAY